MVWLGGLAALAFFSFLGSRDIAASHEARVAQAAREMAEVGWPWNARWTPVAPVVLSRRLGMVRLEPDATAPPVYVNPWMVPLLKGEIRLQKPPLAYWCTAALYRLFGFSEAATRLAPALLGVLSTFLVYDLARLLLGRRRAWLAGLIWVSTQFIPEQFRLAMADPYLAFCTLLAVWSWVKGVTLHRVVRAQGEQSVPITHRPELFIVIFYFSLGMGLIAKGPALLIHVAAAIALFHFCYRRRVPGLIGSHFMGLGLMLLVAAPWYHYVLRHVPNAMELWRYESVGELSDNVENARAWWFYLPNLPMIAIPWIVIWVTSWVHVLRFRRVAMVPLARTTQGVAAAAGGDDAVLPYRPPVPSHSVLLGPRRVTLFAALWLGILVIFFSFVHLKKNPYLLPDMPAQTLLMAQGLGAVLAGARRARLKGDGPMILGAQALIGLGFALALPFVIFYYARERVLGELIALVAIAAAIVAFRASRRDLLRGWVLPQTIAYVLLAIAFSRFVMTPQDNDRSAKVIAPELLTAAAERGRTLLVSRLPEEVAVYLPARERYRPTARHVLIVSDDQDGVLARKRGQRHAPEQTPEPSAFANLFPNERILFVDRVPMKSAPGDSRWKVYELTVDRRFYARSN